MGGTHRSRKEGGMRRNNRPALVIVHCRRCGKPVTTNPRYADTALYQDLGQICSGCASREEIHRANIETGEMIAKEGGRR